MAEVEDKVFFYTQDIKLAEEKVKTPALALAEVNSMDFSKTLANMVEGGKVKTLTNIMAIVEAKAKTIYWLTL